MIKAKCITCNFNGNFYDVKKHCISMKHNIFENNRINVIVDLESFENEFIIYCQKYLKNMLKENFDYILESFNDDKFPELEGDDISDVIENESKFITKIQNKVILTCLQEKQT